MIPEARQIEVAVVGGEVGGEGDSQVEIDALLRRERHGEPTEVALPRLLLGDDDGQRLVGGEQASVGGAGELQVVADGSIAGLFQTELVAHVRCLHLCSKSSKAERTHNGFQNRFHISLFYRFARNLSKINFKIYQNNLSTDDTDNLSNRNYQKLSINSSIKNNFYNKYNTFFSIHGFLCG